MTGETIPIARTEPPLRVRDFMTPCVFTLRERDSLLQARALFEARGIRHAPVVDQGRRLIGLATKRDLLRRVSPAEGELPADLREAQLRTARVGDIMTTEVNTIGPEVEISQAARIMFENKYGCLPVVEHDELVGILTEADFVRYFISARE